VREVPGVIAAADTLEATEQLIAEALQFHLNLETEPKLEFLLSA
jgi:predicted RNase H-like HicB family nuclease